MPKKTYIIVEETKMLDHKPMKDRLTLLFCGNVSGDLQIKLLLGYHSETPQAFKCCKVNKSCLSVMWHLNANAWVTRLLFIEWINKVFSPAVKRYLQEKNLPLKCWLVLDNAPAHPPGFKEDLLEEFKFIKIQFFPPNTTPLIQPMDQQVISNFKKLYTKFLFHRCSDITESTNLTLKEFWKHYFDTVNCLQLIDKAWEAVTIRTLDSAWQKLWLDAVQECDFERYRSGDWAPAEEEDSIVEEGIVTFGHDMELQVDTEDVDDLIAEHTDELMTDELVALQQEQEEEKLTEVTEEEGEEVLTTMDIKDFLRKWEQVCKVIEIHHPDKVNVRRSVNLREEKSGTLGMC